MIEICECIKALSLLFIPTLGFLIFKAIKINEKINGKWIDFFAALISLKRTKRLNQNRIEFYDFKRVDDPYKSGFLPSDHEWDLETPDFRNDEHIFLFGVNSKAQLLKVLISKSKEENGKVALKAVLHLKLDRNTVYTLNEEYLLPVSDLKSKEYKIGSLFLEVLNPFRRFRLKFRGYLREEKSDELVYVRFRLHWFSNTSVYDHKCSFETLFAAQQFAKNGCKSFEFENRLEQFGQIKGTVNIESEPQKQILLWGARSKTFNSKNVNSSRFYGIAKNGHGFSIGFVHDKERNIKYMYGLVKDISGVLRKVKRITLQNCDLESIPAESFDFLIETKENNFKINVKSEISNQNLSRDATIDESDAKCIAFYEDYGEDYFSRIKNKNHAFIYSVANVAEKNCELVLPLSDKKAQSVIISGGKGSSLASLTTLSKILNEKFKVPRGLIVTSNAYDLLLEENEDLKKAIDNLQQLAWSRKCDLKFECEQVVNLISNYQMPERVQAAIAQHLDRVYGNLVSEKSFAVRSSAVGEDSEEMSGAGQLTTFLGVKGKENISKAVIKCWASQFGFNYTEYKRGYGQLINNKMAIVILEMVDCDTAGVVFTCNPLNGDERQIVITANYGLGESVVSASAEPDTIRVKINVKSNDLNDKRTVDGIESIEVGRKEKFIKVNEEGGTVEMNRNSSEKCCLDTNDIMKLAEVCLHVHAYYGNSRDIEWGIKDGEIWLLQSRPITSLDHTYTEWEITHDIGHGFQRENEFFTRIHWNENFPGATSPLTMSTFIKMLDEYFQQTLNKLYGQDPHHPENFCPYISKCLVPFYSQVFMNYGEITLRDRSNKFEMISFAGKIIEDEELFSDMARRDKEFGHSLLLRALCQLIYNLTMNRTLVNRTRKTLESMTWFPNKQTESSSELFDEIKATARHGFNLVLGAHSRVTTAATMLTGIILNALYDGKVEYEDVFHDFGKILSTCSGTLSAEVPKMLREIARSIENHAEFSEMNDEEALKYLLSEKNEASKKFVHFLKRHGCRGMRELDYAVLQWGDEPIKLVHLLKTFRQNELKEEASKVLSVSEVLSTLKTKPSFLKRLSLRWFLLPLAFRNIRLREESKSTLAFYASKYREAFWNLAKKISYEEGKLPDPELMFYLTYAEIDSLIKERNASLVMKAKRRRNMHSKLDKLLFDDIVKDWEAEQSIDVSKLSGALTVKGTAVTHLSVKGRLFVAHSLEDAKDLKNGDILLTHTTDIGWSPYFPKLSGIVTEMGGLNSHGAVIAREFGLPCLIAISNGCELFKTGDVVYINGENGTITRLEE